MSKKGQVQTIAPAIIALLVAGVFLVLGAVILQSMRNTDIVRNAVSVSITNETFTSIDDDGEICDGAAGVVGFHAFSVNECINASEGEVIESANYTISDGGIVSMALTAANIASEYNATPFNCSYTGTRGDVTYADANATLTGLATFADFWEIIILAIVISVVIGLLLLAFGGSGRR